MHPVETKTDVLSCWHRPRRFALLLLAPALLLSACSLPFSLPDASPPPPAGPDVPIPPPAPTATPKPPNSTGATLHTTFPPYSATLLVLDKTP